MRFCKFLLLLSLFLYAACQSGDDRHVPDGSVPPAAVAPAINYAVKGTLPHDTSLFTEGLTDYILKIDPVSGKVIGRLDLGSLVADARNKNPGADALNGIAYDPVSDKIYVTGKRWPVIYQIDFPH